MSEQEPNPTPIEPIPVHKYLLSALPALGATVFILIHLRDAIVPYAYQPVLMNAWLGLLCATLTYWMYLALCRVAEQICVKFDARHDDLAQRFEAHAAASARDFRLAMAKLGKACKRVEAIERQQKEMAEQNEEMTEEIAHLRGLLVATDPSSLTGPTPYS
jgi:hypothetical protein